jgi:hypothetical protein
MAVITRSPWPSYGLANSGGERSPPLRLAGLDTILQDLDEVRISCPSMS